jgi:hypothetical protein
VASAGREEGAIVTAEKALRILLQRLHRQADETDDEDEQSRIRERAWHCSRLLGLRQHQRLADEWEQRRRASGGIEDRLYLDRH